MSIKRGRPAGTTIERDAKILELDHAGDMTLAEIGDRFHLSGERVRQILAKLGAPAHQLRHQESRKLLRDQVAAETVRRAQERIAARRVPSKRVIRIAKLYAQGITVAEIAARMGLAERSLYTTINSRYRRRWPALFPTRKRRGRQPAGFVRKQDLRPYTS